MIEFISSKDGTVVLATEKDSTEFVVPAKKRRPKSVRASITGNLYPELIKKIRDSNSKISPSAAGIYPCGNTLHLDPENTLREYEKDLIFVSLLLSALKYKRPKTIVLDKRRYEQLYDKILRQYENNSFVLAVHFFDDDILYVGSKEMERRVQYFLDLNWSEFQDVMYRYTPMIDELKSINDSSPMKRDISPAPKTGLFSADSKIYNAIRLEKTTARYPVSDLQKFILSNKRGPVACVVDNAPHYVCRVL